jgi:hypothetical protein
MHPPVSSPMADSVTINTNTDSLVEGSPSNTDNMERQALPVPPLPLTLTKEELRQNRIFMTLCNYLLSYPRYSISLFIILATRSLPLPTRNAGFAQPLRVVRTVSQEESDLYVECAQHAFRSIERTINTTALKEWQRVERVRQSNVDLLARAKEVSQSCTNSSIMIQQALQVWQRQNPQESIWRDGNDTISICSSQDRERLSLWPTSESAAYGDEAAAILDSYSSTSLISLRSLVDYSKRRSRYDYDYFVGVKIQGLLELLKTYPAVNISLPSYNVSAELQVELQGLLNAVLVFQNMMGVLNLRVTDFYSSILKLNTGYLDMIRRLQLSREYIIDFGKVEADIPPFLNLNSIPDVALLLPQVLEVPHLDDLPDIPVLLSLTIQRILDLITKLMKLVAEEASEDLYRALEILYSMLERLTLLEDYDPPKYAGSRSTITSIDGELDGLTSTGNAARNRMDGILARMQAAKERVLEDPMPSPNTSSRQSFANGNFTDFKYLQLEFPSFSMPDIMANFFAFLSSQQWLIEFVIQLIHLIRLKRKYERNATPDLPEINLNTDDDSADRDKAQSSRLGVIWDAVLCHLVTPWMALAMIVLPMFFLGASVWIPHVYASCRHSRNGTFVAHRVIAPLMINKANAAGQVLRARNERHCRLLQEQLCNRYYSESDALYQQDMYDLHVIHISGNESLQNVMAVQSCINTTFLDRAFDSGCCGLEGYGRTCDTVTNYTCAIDRSFYAPTPYRQISEYISNSQCEQILPPVEIADSRFQCDVIRSVCEFIPCTGVDEDYILHMTMESDCVAEVYLVQICILVLLCVYHAIMVNLCCTLAFHGIKRLQWRRLRPDGVKLQTQVNSKGELTKGGNLEERARLVNQVMKRFERVGRMQVIGAVVFFLLWIVSFFVLRQQLSIYK